MAIAFDQKSANSATGTSVTISHTCTGSNLILMSFVFSTSGDDVSGVTYNGVAMTQAVKAANSYAGGYGYIYYLVGPATGANNVVASRSTSTGTLGILNGSYTGAKQTGQPDSTGSSYSATRPISWNQTITAVNSWIFGGEMCNGTPTAGTNTFMRNTTAFVGSEGMFDSNADIGSGSQSFSVTSSINTDIYRISATFAPLVTGPANVKTVNGLAIASVKTVDELAIASVKTWDGLN